MRPRARSGTRRERLKTLRAHTAAPAPRPCVHALDLKRRALLGSVHAAPDAFRCCLMHLRREPRTVQAAPRQANVAGTVRAVPDGRMAAGRAAGVEAGRLPRGPGIGFGKAGAHKLASPRVLGGLPPAGLPTRVGVSRKRFIGCLTGRPRAGRLAGSGAPAALAARPGAAAPGPHGVPETAGALNLEAAHGVPETASALNLEAAPTGAEPPHLEEPHGQ